MSRADFFRRRSLIEPYENWFDILKAATLQEDVSFTHRRGSRSIKDSVPRSVPSPMWTHADAVPIHTEHQPGMNQATVAVKTEDIFTPQWLCSLCDLPCRFSKSMRLYIPPPWFWAHKVNPDHLFDENKQAAGSKGKDKVIWPGKEQCFSLYTEHWIFQLYRQRPLPRRRHANLLLQLSA